ncbi:MAG: transposase, partial [Acidobacteriota bacterium]
ADRLSCHRFVANQFRLLLHALAYQLLLALRRYLEGTPWHKLEIETLRRRVFKLGARIRETTRRIWIHCSSSYPEQETFFLVLRRICGPPG